MNKKVIALFTAGISLSVLTPLSPITTYAEITSEKAVEEQVEEKNQAIGQQEALQIAEAFFGEELANAQYYYEQNWYRDNIPVWNIHYEENEGENWEFYHITINATNGKVLETSYDRNVEGEEPPSYPPEVTWEEGKEKADEIINQYFSDIKGEIKLDPSTKPQKPALTDQVVHTYQYNRVIDGVPLSNNQVQININGSNELVSFNSSWDHHIELESNAVNYTTDEALSLFQEKLPVELQYNSLDRFYRPANDGSGEMILEYALNDNYPYLDATTGEWINRQGETEEHGEEIDQEAVVSEPLQPKRMIQSIMTEQEAETLAREIAGIPEEMVIDNIQYYQDDHQPATWDLTFTETTEGQENYDTYSVSISLNATTGEVYHYFVNDPQLYGDLEADEAVVGYEEAKAKAIEIIKQFAPEKADNIYYNATEYNNNNGRSKHHLFTFQRKENGIPVRGDSINVSISAIDGKLVDYYQSWQNNVTFPSFDDVISKETAFERFLERYEIDLGWEMIADDSQENKETYRKVYFLDNLHVFDQAVYLNAKTGNWHSRLTDEIVTVNPEANDIEGLLEEEALKLMIAYGAIPIDENGNIHPEQPITRGEMVKMLMLANNPDPLYYYDMGAKYANSEGSFDDVTATNEYFSYVEEAIRKGFLDQEDENFKPNELVTRMELAQLLVHALEYDQIAGYADMFQHPYQDISSEEQAGYVAIVHYLNIMSTTSDEFKPEQEVTRAQAAQIFYQYLTVRGSVD
ncbi:hypothetical protein F9U64_07195 [Gracilibacillus oryzae]|uniref:SLH domain-containing protein n=1 Tax=Gracilibacillus oryzae TaxID=1672701 RepID=A0A7C8KZE5_9BACI|nr:YcdB/YcdC domain-containing protein [Gracilibacillus oryzae]KAB8137994.1 hypothetical protein F9U64_07195 [Gracilibacillus oryzae]